MGKASGIDWGWQGCEELRARETESRALWKAFGRRENERVPVYFLTDESLFLKVIGRTFREFYTDPRVHLEAQLTGQRWFAENVAGDQPPTDKWPVSAQIWMEENEFFGCEVVIQENEYAWGKPLDLRKRELIEHIRGINAEERIKEGSAYKMYKVLRELTAGKRYGGKEIGVAVPGSTQGVFTKAAEIRGLEQICVDMYDDAEFVDELMGAVTEKTIERIKAWNRIVWEEERKAKGEAAPTWPRAQGCHTCDDSLQMISGEQYERFVMRWHQKLYGELTAGRRAMHLCGRSWQHYRTLVEKVGITALDGPGMFVDHGEWLRELGEEFTLEGQMNHTVLITGSKGEIEEMMGRLMRPETRIAGRFQVKGGVWPATSMEKARWAYESGRRLGRIG